MFVLYFILCSSAIFNFSVMQGFKSHVAPTTLGFYIYDRLKCLKLNGTHQLLAYADDVNILGGSVHTVKKNAEALVAATKEIGLAVNAHKTKYMTMS